MILHASCAAGLSCADDTHLAESTDPYMIATMSLIDEWNMINVREAAMPEMDSVHGFAIFVHMCPYD